MAIQEECIEKMRGREGREGRGKEGEETMSRNMRSIDRGIQEGEGQNYKLTKKCENKSKMKERLY